MIIDILQHTPLWVFALFIALVALGVRRLRSNDIGVGRLFVLPVAMTGFSLFGLLTAFGPGAVTIAAWGVAFFAVLAAGRALPVRSGVEYSAATRTIRVPGSWLPLALMMTIFFVRYVVAVLLAMHPALHADPSFAAGVAAVYGLTSGGFAARAWMTWRAAFRAQSVALRADPATAGSAAA